MAVKAINNPIYQYTCDLCAVVERGAWIPPNWEGLSVALYNGGMAQLHICGECITTSNIVVLLNKVKTSEQ